MKKVAAFIFFLILSTITTAQWFWQNPLPQGNSLNSVKFISSTTGWAVGYLGTILKTSDRGITWILQSSGTTEDLFGIAFTDINNGTAVGSNGTILRTTNGGAVWVSQSCGDRKSTRLNSSHLGISY